jgi:hypothetical protein
VKKYGRKVSWIVKRLGKYGENMEESQAE